MTPAVSQDYSRTDCPPNTHFLVEDGGDAMVAGCNSHGNNSVILGECSSISGYESLCGEYGERSIDLNERERSIVMVVVAGLLVGLAAFIHEHTHGVW